MKNLATHQTILLGATITVGKCVLVAIVQHFEEAYPHIKIEVTIDNTATIEKMLLQSQLDMGLVEGQVQSNELEIIPAIPDELVLVCNRQHEYANRQFVVLAELSSQPFILREIGSGTRELFEEKILPENIRLKPKWTCHGSDSIIKTKFISNSLEKPISFIPQK